MTGHYETDAAHVYILECADGSYYVGSARGSLDVRLGQHASGALGGYTAKRRPVRLAWTQAFQHITDAIAVERQLKKWRREKKEALIRGDFDALPRLAKRPGARVRGEVPHPSRAAAPPPQDEDSGDFSLPEARAQRASMDEGKDTA